MLISWAIQRGHTLWMDRNRWLCSLKEQTHDLENLRVSEISYSDWIFALYLGNGFCGASR